MGYRRTPLAPGEWYHCFTRGVDKRSIFETTADFNRFTELLYLSNSDNAIDRGNLKRKSHNAIFDVSRGSPLVHIGAYCLMNNHPHILLQESTEGGISKFLQKVFTGYTMYFNIKRKRVGNLFVTPFRSKHISNDKYLKRVVQYIHLNPADVFERGWKYQGTRDVKTLEKKLLSYPYSSAADYFGNEVRPEASLLDSESRKFLADAPAFSQVIAEADSYYKELNAEFGRQNV